MCVLQDKEGVTQTFTSMMMLHLVPGSVSNANLQCWAIECRKNLQEPAYLVCAAETDEGECVCAIVRQHILYTLTELCIIPLHVPLFSLQHTVRWILDHEL